MDGQARQKPPKASHDIPGCQLFRRFSHANGNGFKLIFQDTLLFQNKGVL